MSEPLSDNQVSVCLLLAFAVASAIHMWWGGSLVQFLAALTLFFVCYTSGVLSVTMWRKWRKRTQEPVETR